MNFKKVLLISGVLFFSFARFNSAFATKLPDDVWKFVKASLPDAQQRFDSVITLDENTMYIPLTPPSNTTVNAIALEYTYPETESLAALPEVALLNNGYSLLKVMKDSNGNYSLTKKDDLPIKVRLGLMPQDMLIPVGLKMPESLKLTLGDLLVPSKSEASLVLDENDKQKTTSYYNPTVKRNEFIPSVDFKDKKIYINPKNSKFIEVFDNTQSSPLYELKLSSMPLKIVTSKKTGVALVLYWSGKKLEIIDLYDERVITEIPIEANATDVVLNEKDNVAYVTSANANAIYVVDLSQMQLSQVIKVDQKPSKIAYSEVDNSITFYDEFQSKVFNVTKTDYDYIVQPLGDVANASGLVADVANAYVLSRTDSRLYIFDKTYAKLIDEIDTDKKPTDILMFNNKLFILCSKEGYMDIFDTIEQKMISREQLSKTGFYSKMTRVANDNNILITGMSANQYLLYNLDKMEVVKKQDSYIDVANILILDKSQRL